LNAGFDLKTAGLSPIPYLTAMPALARWHQKKHLRRLPLIFFDV
jgi:hypothetical protein